MRIIIIVAANKLRPNKIIFEAVWDNEVIALTALLKCATADDLDWPSLPL